MMDFAVMVKGSVLMACKDCLHCEICIDYLAKCAEHGEAERINNLCAKFKNKADFVEVVRCKDCKFSHEDYFGQWWCRKNLREETLVKDENYFCSYGERKK